jgi:hypothetical protein
MHIILPIAVILFFLIDTFNLGFYGIFGGRGVYFSDFDVISCRFGCGIESDDFS